MCLVSAIFQQEAHSADATAASVCTDIAAVIAFRTAAATAISTAAAIAVQFYNCGRTGGLQSRRFGHSEKAPVIVVAAGEGSGVAARARSSAPRVSQIVGTGRHPSGEVDDERLDGPTVTARPGSARA